MSDTEPDAPRWYAIRVRQRIQFDVDRLLQAKGIESYFPFVIESHRWSDRSRKVRVALFQGYSFVRIAWRKAEMLTVLRTPGVIGFVPANGTRAPIRSGEIEAVRKAADTEGCAPCLDLVQGRKVRVRGGCLDGVEGTIVRSERGERLVISVGHIERSVSVPLHNCQVERCDEN